jgi:hypothetical protein
VTRASGDVRDAIGRPVEAGQLAAVDPDCRCIALHLYDGQLKVRVCQDDLGGTILIVPIAVGLCTDAAQQCPCDVMALLPVVPAWHLRLQHLCRYTACLYTDIQQVLPFPSPLASHTLHHTLC